jgi:hypothetical protein
VRRDGASLSHAFRLTAFLSCFHKIRVSADNSEIDSVYLDVRSLFKGNRSSCGEEGWAGGAVVVVEDGLGAGPPGNTSVCLTTIGAMLRDRLVALVWWKRNNA